MASKLELKMVLKYVPTCPEETDEEGLDSHRRNFERTGGAPLARTRFDPLATVHAIWTLPTNKQSF